MLANLSTKIALRKVGVKSDTFDFSSLTEPSRRETNRLRKKGPPQGWDDDDDNAGWSSWVPSINMKSLPLAVTPWLSPKPAPVATGRVPSVGDAAPADRDAKLKLGRGRRALVVFMRCVGCACMFLLTHSPFSSSNRRIKTNQRDLAPRKIVAQKTFMALRSIANRHPDTMRCIAVSHSSAHATQKWIDLMGGAWNVEVVVDEDRSLYAAWGLGVASLMYLFHPAAQVQGWKETGWLGDEVAAAVNRTQGLAARQRSAFDDDDDDDGEDNSGVMGSKWQEAGAFAVDGKGTVIWGGKATRSDDMMNLEEGARILQL